jgi:hypothetical protein
MNFSNEIASFTKNARPNISCVYEPYERDFDSCSQVRGEVAMNSNRCVPGSLLAIGGYPILPCKNYLQVSDLAKV